MAGDKGAEARIAQHNIEGALKKNIPEGSTLGEIRDKFNARPVDFGEKEGFKTLSDETHKQLQEALDRHARPKGPSAAFRRAISGAIGSLRRRGRQLPSNETARRIVDKPETPQEAPDYSSLGRTRDVRINPITEHSLRANHDSPSSGEKYFGSTDETPKPSEE